MSAKTHNFRIGLFVLVGALLFVGALFAMGLRTYFGKRDVFETCVTGKVENLSVGALVKLRGVTIGKVSSIDFIGTEYPAYKQQYVLIQFEIPKGTVWGTETGNIQQLLDTEIAQGLRARVQGQGFLGANIVALEYIDPKLYPVEPIAWTPKHYYIPSAPSQFNRVMASLEKSLRHAEDLDLAELLERVKTLIDVANQLAGNVNQVDFKQLGTNAGSLIVEFRETNRGLQRTLADAQNAINGADLPAIGRDTAALEAKLSSTVLELRHLLASVDTGELNSSLANVRAATDEMIVLLHNLEQRPSSVLFSKPPRPLTELEKPPRK
ncbi:MAG TPA: MlaD family protein [Candidatus Binatia bacterium]|jgi:ABC-type transporter Mla subunit MlaD|nr:MlaD family protein [Candidatus Binatia bacterium]